MKLASLVAALALLGAGPVMAQSHEHTGAVSETPEKIVCKRVVETGSLVRGKRTCKTQAAWDRDGEAARKQVREIQDATLVNSSRPN
ncbi:MAG: hypothetical protein WBR13_06385 [Allosphingosinicella sp.]